MPPVQGRAIILNREINTNLHPHSIITPERNNSVHVRQWAGATEQRLSMPCLQNTPFSLCPPSYRDARLLAPLCPPVFMSLPTHAITWEASQNRRTTMMKVWRKPPHRKAHSMKTKLPMHTTSPKHNVPPQYTAMEQGGGARPPSQAAFTTPNLSSTPDHDTHAVQQGLKLQDQAPGQAQGQVQGQVPGQGLEPRSLAPELQSDPGSSPPPISMAFKTEPPLPAPISETPQQHRPATGSLQLLSRPPRG